MAMMEVLAEHQITTEPILAGITEQDLSDMHLVVGHKIISRRVIANLVHKSVVIVKANFGRLLFEL